MRLIHGDCLEEMAKIPSGSVDMVLTDIPYGEVNRKSGGLRQLDKGKADDCSIDLDSMTREVMRVMTGTAYLFCGIDQISIITIAFKNLGASTRLGQWEKSNPSPMNGDKVWLSGSEFCVIARKPKSVFNEHCQKPIWKFPCGRNKLHPTQKPVALMERLILASSNEGETVLDFTMGSGTTGVACKNLGRDFIGIEKDDKYFEIAKERIGK